MLEQLLLLITELKRSLLGGAPGSRTALRMSVKLTFIISSLSTVKSTELVEKYHN